MLLMLLQKILIFKNKEKQKILIFKNDILLNAQIQKNLIFKNKIKLFGVPKKSRF